MALVDEILDFASQPAAATEVGAGTGKASVLFAARGVRLTCLEPDPAMAEIARVNLAAFDAQVVETPFEPWQPPEPAALLYAAQAWHWVAPAARVAKAHQVLARGATLALFWNLGTYADDGLRRALADVYRQVAPGTAQPWQANEQDRLDSNGWAAVELAESGRFGPVTTARHRWGASYSTEGWIELATTQSDHRMMDERTRDTLLDQVRDAVDAHGGTVKLDYVTTAYLTQAA